MLSTAQEKLIRSLQTKKGRTESGLCLVEGEKNIVEAKGFIDFTFTAADTKSFTKLLDTVTPQAIAAVAKIPRWESNNLLERPCVVVLDGVQDPGNVGTILRLCLGFNASLLLIESADPSNPKVVRASAGAFFKVPWLEVPRAEAEETIASLGRPIFRLEKNESSVYNLKKLPKELVLIAGSEGQGIKLQIAGEGLSLPHEPQLESLNVASAITIVLFEHYLHT
jgi:TrmH family RNA methyltransferase